MASQNWVWWGVYWPWAEANQGMLSVGAIALTAILFLLELRRANAAEEREVMRSNQAMEREIELSRIAEERRQTQAINSEIQRFDSFAVVAKRLIVSVEADLVKATEAHRALQSETDSSYRMVPSRLVSDSAAAARGGLEAILAAAPMDAGLILAIREACLVMHEACAPPNSSSFGFAKDLYEGWAARLRGSREKIDDQVRAHTHMLRPQPPPAPPELPSFHGHAHF